LKKRKSKKTSLENLFLFLGKKLSFITFWDIFKL